MDNKQKKLIPPESIENRLSILGYDWKSPDYFISPDEGFRADKEKLPFRPNYYILGICVEGWVKFKVNEKLLTFCPYSFFAAAPNCIIKRINQSPDCKVRYLFFTKDFLLKNIINLHQLESFLFFTSNIKSVQLDKDDAEPFIQLYDILKRKRDNSDSSHDVEIIRSLFLTFLYEAAAVYQKDKKVTQPKFTRFDDLNLKFQQLLLQHDKVQHNLKFYADSLFITPKYLIHAIKNASGKTPGKLIDEAIIAEAKVLLTDYDNSIAMVAEHLHFSDQAAFSKFFKKNTGITPVSYRSKG